MPPEPLTPTLAHKLGVVPHISQLRRKARRLGLVSEADLAAEAVARGCFHYMLSNPPPAEKISEEQFSNEELAMALLSVANPYDPRLIRVGAMLLSAEGNDPKELASYAAWERCVAVVCAIAEAALIYESENPFWRDLLEALPPEQPVPEGVIPHHTRYVSMPGLIGPRKFGKAVWLRPRKIAALGYAG